MTEAIQTERLLLVPVTPEHVTAFFKSRGDLSLLLGAAVPDDWPVCPEIMEYWREKSAALSELAGWAGYAFIHREKRVAVGDGGFKNRPDAEGKVELGYSIVPAYRRRGYATEAVMALIAWAFGHSDVKYVTAETSPRARESMRILEKIGMAYQGIRQDAREGMLFLWQISRADYNKQPAPESEGCPYS